MPASLVFVVPAEQPEAHGEAVLLGEERGRNRRARIVHRLGRDAARQKHGHRVRGEEEVRRGDPTRGHVARESSLAS